MDKNICKHVISGAALALCAGLSLSGAHAADLGGNCCADLEERIAELEATTARKGNRKVSLEISGWVTQQLMYWDDGQEQNAYVVDTLTDVGSQVHFTGKAQINAEWSAGYNLFINTQTATSFQVDQNADNTGGGISVLNSYWYAKSTRLGQVSLGFQSQATDNIAIHDLSGVGSLFAANLVVFDGAGMLLRPEGGNGLAKASWASIAYCNTIGAGIFADCHGDRTNSVRYDSPTFAGFTVSTSWGEDDFWDVAARYAGDWGDFKASFGIGWTEQRDGMRNGISPDTNLIQFGGSIIHNPTGIFGVIALGHEYAQEAGIKDTDQLYLKGGWRAKLNPLGATVFYGEWGRDKDMFGGITLSGSAGTCAAFDGAGGAIDAACLNAADTNVRITDSNFERWGFGVVQEIDAAAMSVWAKYKQHNGDVDFADGGGRGKQDFEKLHQFLLGGVIFY